MTWVDGQVKGFDCRATSGYVTDPTDNTWLVVGDTYPTTRNDVTFGISAGSGTWNSLDGDSAVTDKRLAGVGYVAPATPTTIRVDLPAAGNYRFRIANGYTGSSFAAYRQIIIVKDTASTVLTLDNATGPAQDHYFDATAVDRTEANWPSLNAGVTLTFATTICNIIIGDAAAGYTACAHFSLEKLAPVTGSPTLSSIVPTSTYAHPSSRSTLLDCHVIGTNLDVALGAGGASLTCNDGDIQAVTLVYTSATRIDFFIQMNAGTAPGVKTWTATTDGGTSGTVSFTVTDPAATGGGGSIFGTPIVT